MKRFTPKPSPFVAPTSAFFASPIRRLFSTLPFISFAHRISQKLVGQGMTETLRQCLNQLRRERALSCSHHHGCSQAKAYAGKTNLRLHLGCGNVHKPGWINIDSYAIPPCVPDLTLDLRRPLPFADGTCAEVYSEHVFEHIAFPDAALHLLDESLRVLSPGGIVSIGVPDPRPVIEAWLHGTHDPYFDYFFNFPNIPRHLGEKMEAVNWLFRQGGEHEFIYDYPSLEKMLRRAGFTNMARREFDPARDSEARRHGTIYVDACKPA